MVFARIREGNHGCRIHATLMYGYIIWCGVMISMKWASTLESLITGHSKVI